MAAQIHRLRDRAGETEKITINLGYVDLGHIDLLVQEGFYSNRTDFIRTAIRNRLAAHEEEVKKSIVRHTLELGLRHFTRADLEAARASGEKLHIKVLGLTSIAPDGACLGDHRIDHGVGCPARDQGDQERVRRSHSLTPRITHLRQRNQDMKMDLADGMRAATKLSALRSSWKPRASFKAPCCWAEGRRTGCRGAGNRATHDRYRPGCRTNRD